MDKTPEIAKYDIESIRQARALEFSQEVTFKEKAASIWNRITAMIGEAPASRIAGIDLSAYNNSVQIDFPEMVANQVLFTIVRSSCGSTLVDSKCPIFVTKAKDAGMKVGLYHWDDPLDYWQDQVNLFESLIVKYDPKIVALDVEQWWSDWNAFYRALRGEITWAQVPRLSGDVISNAAQRKFAYLKGRFPDKKVMIYTSGGFVNSYSPQMNSWIGNTDVWIANYITNTQRSVTWAEFWDIISKLGRPYLPSGVLREVMWQFETVFTLPKAPERYDASVFNGTATNFYDWLNNVLPPPPTALPKYFVNAWIGLNVRTGPGVNYPKAGPALPYKTVVTGYQESGSWLRIDQYQQKWVSMVYLTKMS